jgi:hypothetical protein
MRSRWLKRELGPGTWKDGEGELVAGRGMREGEGVSRKIVWSWSCCIGEGLGHGDEFGSRAWSGEGDMAAGRATCGE